VRADDEEALLWMWELLGGPGILNAAVRCEGFKIIALAFEKLSLPRRKIE
jgi:hypothetical protein